jgi:hypothetical protein
MAGSTLEPGTDIVVSGSTSNLGPGFDALSVAVTVYLRLRVLEVLPSQPEVLDMHFVGGAAPSGEGPRVKRTLTATGLRQLIAFISRMTAADRAELEGVSAERAPQIVAGALVAEAELLAALRDI